MDRYRHDSRVNVPELKQQNAPGPGHVPELKQQNVEDSAALAAPPPARFRGDGGCSSSDGGIPPISALPGSGVGSSSSGLSSK